MHELQKDDYFVVDESLELGETFRTPLHLKKLRRKEFAVFQALFDQLLELIGDQDFSSVLPTRESRIIRIGFNASGGHNLKTIYVSGPDIELSKILES